MSPLKFSLNCLRGLTRKISIHHFQQSLCSGAMQRPWGLYSLPDTWESSPKIPALPEASNACCCVHQAGSLGHWGMAVAPVSLDRELWEIMPCPGELLWRGVQVLSLGLWAPSQMLRSTPSFSQLFLYSLPPFARTACIPS